MPDRIEDRPEAHRLLDRRMLHEGRVWDVVAETFEYDGAAITREMLDHPGAVAVLALDEDERVLLIRQYRHLIRARDWEIPAGLLDIDGEGPLVGAQRELAEEADVEARSWAVLADYVTTPGGSNESIRIYLAREVSALPAFARHDEEADIEVRWVPLDDVADAVLARRVQNPSLVIGALAAVAARARDFSTLAPADAPWPRHPKLGTPDWS